jgi:hypothetical protein
LVKWGRPKPPQTLKATPIWLHEVAKATKKKKKKKLVVFLYKIKKKIDIFRDVSGRIAPKNLLASHVGLFS